MQGSLAKPNLKDYYYVDNTSSYRNAFWLWSNNVRNEQVIRLTKFKKPIQKWIGFFVSRRSVILIIGGPPVSRTQHQRIMSTDYLKFYGLKVEDF